MYSLFYISTYNVLGGFDSAMAKLKLMEYNDMKIVFIHLSLFKKKRNILKQSKTSNNTQKEEMQSFKITYRHMYEQKGPMENRKK